MPPRPACRYENIVQIRCLLEGVEPEDMLQSWHAMLPEYMQRWGLDRAEVGGKRAGRGQPQGGACLRRLLPTVLPGAAPGLTPALAPAPAPPLLPALCRSWWTCLAAPATSGWPQTWRAGWRQTASTRAWPRPCGCSCRRTRCTSSPPSRWGGGGAAPAGSVASAAWGGPDNRRASHHTACLPQCARPAPALPRPAPPLCWAASSSWP